METYKKESEANHEGDAKQNGVIKDEICVLEVKKTFRSALPQVLATSAKNILLLGYGMTLGFPTIVIPSIEDRGSNTTDPMLRLSHEEISWFSSINLICVPLGCLMSGAITQPLGRRRSMMLINIPFIIAWILFHYASSAAILYLCLVITGFSGGLLEAPVLTYVAEITQPHLRGMLSASSSMAVILGVFIQFLLGSLKIYWREISLINLAFPVAAFVGLFFVPESPHWLIGRGRIQEAEKSLQWLRGWTTPSEVKYELAYLIKTLEASKAKTKKRKNVEDVEDDTLMNRCFPNWRNYLKRNFLRPYLLVSIGFFSGHFAGMTTLQTYAVKIFENLKSPIDEYLATLYLGLAELAGSLLCVILVHWTGKRPLTFVSTIGNGICFMIVAIYAQFFLSTASDSTRWVPTTFLISSAFLSHSGIRLLPWILIGEVYPAEVRGVASGASGSIGYIFGFIANKTFYRMVGSFYLYGTFWFYGGISLISATYFYFQLPETEGQTLYTIQQHFEGKVNLLNKRKVMVECDNNDNRGNVNYALELESNF